LSVDKFVHTAMFADPRGAVGPGLRRQDRYDVALAAGPGAPAVRHPYGGALEIMQGTMLTDRVADLNDFIANSVGCALGWWWLRRQARRAAGCAAP
jgi:VanZ family protein